MDDASWLAAKLAFIDALKKPSDRQQLLALLARKPAPSPDDAKTLAALIRAEKANERALAAQASAARLLKQRSDAERKARNYRLIRQGLLIDQAGLEHWPPEQLLGALSELAQDADPAHHARWRAHGAALATQPSPEDPTP